MKNRIKQAIKEVKSCNANWIKENLKANLNALFNEKNDGSEELSFGISSFNTLQVNMNDKPATKKELIYQLQEILEMEENLN